jgi:arsenite methyltransferase
MHKSEAEIKNAVRRHYADLATVGQGESCCQTSCCGGSPSDMEVIPMEALAVGASCGSPLSHITLRGNETILDLGSGGGIDVFRASKALNSSGKVIGVDATPEMISRARETARKYDYKNVEFRLGEIENLPVESNLVDLVVSNCVLNLVPDKTKAFTEIYRVLKPGGRIAISDMVAVKQLTVEERANLEDWSACITGAITIEQYKQLLSDAGFVNVSSYVNEASGKFDSSNRVVSLTWLGSKPTR